MQYTVNTSVTMPPAPRERMRNLAEPRKASAHAILFQARESLGCREERREAWRREGIAAWEEYQMTGLHLTNAEVVGWMDSIIQGEEAPMPKCHM